MSFELDAAKLWIIHLCCNRWPALRPASICLFDFLPSRDRQASLCALNLRVEPAANYHDLHYIVTALPVYVPFLYEMIAIP